MVFDQRGVPTTEAAVTHYLVRTARMRGAASALEVSQPADVTGQAAAESG